MDERENEREWDDSKGGGETPIYSGRGRTTQGPGGVGLNPTPVGHLGAAAGPRWAPLGRPTKPRPAGPHSLGALPYWASLRVRPISIKEPLKIK